MKEIAFSFALWVLASPILFLIWIARAIRLIRFWKVAYSTSIVCPNCHSEISLVGIWRCGCGYVYKGHLLRNCCICGSLPRMARCYSCNLTTKLPEPE